MKEKVPGRESYAQGSDAESIGGGGERVTQYQGWVL